MKPSVRPIVTRPLMTFLFVPLVILMIGIQSAHLFSLTYRGIEGWSVFESYAHVNIGIQSSRFARADNLPLALWIALFGTAPSVTRYLSVLLNIIGFAFLFRLAADLFNKKTGLIAVFLLATLTVIQNLSGLAQPDAALLMLVPALLLVWLRWLYAPSYKTAALYLGIGLIAVYTCTFSILLIVAQGLFFLVCVPRNRQRDRQAIILFAIITLVALPRVIAIATVNLQTGLPFSSWFVVDLLKLPISILPLEFAQIMLLLALAIIGLSVSGSPRPFSKITLRWNVNRSVTYPLITASISLLLLVFVNWPVGSLYIIAILPVLALLAAHALTSYRWPVQALLLILFVIPSFTGFRDVLPVAPYQDILSKTVLMPDTDSKLIVAAPYIWQHLPFVDGVPQLQNRIFHILPSQASESSSRLPPAQTAYQDDKASFQRVSQFVGNTPELWLYSEEAPTDQPTDFLDNLSKDYDEVHPLQQDNLAYGSLQKYIQIPSTLQKLFVFGDQLALQSWQLKQSVNVTPCERMTVQSWWTAQNPIEDKLSMTLVLTNPADGQGIANTDGLPTGRDLNTLSSDHPQVDERSLQVPCSIQPGSYPLLIGIYNLLGNQIHQLPVTASDGSPLGNFAYLTTLFVNP